MARKRRVETITLFPNPYHCMGAAGALGGAAPLPEKFHGGSLPARQYVGAERRHENFIPGHKEAEKASRSDRFFVFDCVAKTYEIPAGTRADFECLIRDKAAFRVKSEDEIPIAELAEARIALVVDHANHHTEEDPDFEFWQEQFPLDAQIAELTKSTLDAKLAEIAKRAEEARASVASNVTPADLKAEAARVSREEFIAKAQERAKAAIAEYAKAKSAALAQSTAAPAASPEPIAADKPQKRGASAPKE